MLSCEDELRTVQAQVNVGLQNAGSDTEERAATLYRIARMTDNIVLRKLLERWGDTLYLTIGR